jgi:uncharacterized protein YciI
MRGAALMARPVLHVVRLTNTDLSHYDEHFQAHIAWVKQHAEAAVFLFAGSLEDRTAGGMIIAKTESRAALDRILRDDPFLIHGVATHEVTTFNVSLGCNAHTLD